jgi:hypothetical protein
LSFFCLFPLFMVALKINFLSFVFRIKIWHS